MSGYSSGPPTEVAVEDPSSIKEPEPVEEPKPLVVRYNLNGDLYRLPTELLDSIYDSLSSGTSTAVDVKEHIDSTTYNPSFLPQICQTSVETLWDAAPAFIRNAIFETRSFKANRFLHQFLESVPNGHGFDSVKRLHFHSFQHFPQNSDLVSSDIALMKRCSSLHTVLLNFHVSKLVTPEPRWDPYDEGLTASHPRSVEEIVEHYQLEGLIECAALKKIVFVGIDQYAIGRSCSADPLTALHDLGAWLKEQFAERKKRYVDIGYYYRCGRYLTDLYHLDAEVET
ncbi:hypothetical protein BDV96DRAFT_604025 [Lophiotrema nucula]|uniref:Uncharacterized protein n=1 Tax=Lophiotrema nucula TaxID=690887 RepID=A0A6A5YWF1_9PLEO|nr:hypothetical protein BDV96DRAFT_604025 [Lophiotrema nucula]